MREKSPYSEFFWSAFCCIWTEYRDLQSKSLYSIWMRENADQKHSEYRHFYAVLDSYFNPIKFDRYRNYKIQESLKEIATRLRYDHLQKEKFIFLKHLTRNLLQCFPWLFSQPLANALFLVLGSIAPWRYIISPCSRAPFLYILVSLQNYDYLPHLKRYRNHFSHLPILESSMAMKKTLTSVYLHFFYKL